MAGWELSNWQLGLHHWSISLPKTPFCTKEKHSFGLNMFPTHFFLWSIQGFDIGKNLTQGPSCSYLGSSSAHFLEHHLDCLEASAERLQCDTHGRTNESTNMAQKWTFLFQHIFGWFINIVFQLQSIFGSTICVYIYTYTSMCVYIYNINIEVDIYIYICHIYEYIDTQWTHPTLDRHCPSPAHRIRGAAAMAEPEMAVEMAGEMKKQKLKKNKMTVPWDYCGIIVDNFFCIIFHCG